MGELRAYALPVAALRAGVGSSGGFRGLVRTALASRPTTTAERLGPIHRRVPGARVVRDDDPSPADLEAFLDGVLPPGRAAAGWRLVEAVAAGLARSSTALSATDLPAVLLAPLDLGVPPVAGLVAGWCRIVDAAAVPALAGWVDTVEHADTADPTPDVVVLGRA